MPSRRTFLHAASGTALATSLTEFGSLAAWGETVAAEAAVSPDLVRLQPGIEPIVEKIEQTPRGDCFRMAAGLLQAGLPYRQFMAALFLAGIRNVNPQPPGFKFHCVFVIHAAHQLSLDAPAGERLLPMFWALDAFKDSQQQDVRQGDFRLGPLTGKLPAPEKAWDAFHAAMNDWDEEAAQHAVAALARSRGAHEVIAGLWQYGARDYRNIGHKAIFVANTWRTLQTIGWQHAEPALRSLVLGLLDFGRDEKVNDYAFADQSYVGNAERAKRTIAKLPGNWTAATADPVATRELLAAIRSGNVDAACDAAQQQLLSGKVSAQAVWDAVHLASGELMMRQPGIYGIHTVTSTNGLRYAYQMAASPETRLMLTLQGVGWMSQFRNFMSGKPQGLNDVRIDQLEPGEIAKQPGDALEEIFDLVGNNNPAAAAKTLHFARLNPQLGELPQTARRLLFRKAMDAHDYKYTASVFEDYGRVSPAWQPQLAATAVYYLRGNKQQDSPVMAQAQQAVRGLLR